MDLLALCKSQAGHPDAKMGNTLVYENSLCEETLSSLLQIRGGKRMLLPSSVMVTRYLILGCHKCIPCLFVLQSTKLQALSIFLFRRVQ